MDLLSRSLGERSPVLPLSLEGSQMVPTERPERPAAEGVRC